MSEILFNKAREYGRHDICLLIASRSRLGLRLNLKVLTDFKKNVNLYEKTGEQQYKDKATGRYYHRILWQEVINYIAEGRYLSIGITNIKKRVLKKKKLPTPWRNYCYACLTTCDECSISKKAGKCFQTDSAFSLLCDAVRLKDREAARLKDKEAAVKYASIKDKQEAIRQASIIMEAWEE